MNNFFSFVKIKNVLRSRHLVNVFPRPAGIAASNFSFTSFTSSFKNHYMSYPTPSSLNYMWGLGSLAFSLLLWQIITGLFILTHYDANIEFAFESVERLTNEVSYGWFLRNCHAGGASVMFVALYIHIGRGFYYRSYRFMSVWISGLIIFILMMAVAFCGYVLPWGQMSYWGATVISNLLTIIPTYGAEFVNWLWGGFAIGTGTLKRFLTIHMGVSFGLLFLVIVHLKFLHDTGSSNPISSSCKGMDYVRFEGKFVEKDVFGILLIGGLFVFIAVFFLPYLLGHSDNSIKANGSITPAHIQPEWYFLPFYAMLRAMPTKFIGVIVMGGSLLICFLLPLLDLICMDIDQRTSFIGKVFFWLFIFNFICLFWLGSCPIEEPYVFAGVCCTFFYFSYFVLFLPIILLLENLVLYNDES